MTYNLDGSVASMLTSGIHGAVTGWNAITLTNSFNNRLQPTQLQAVSPVPLTLLNLSYSYDQGSGTNNGNVVQITNGRDSTRTVAYSYDQLNRLSTAQTPSAATWGDSYGYDAWGNLLQKNMIKGTVESMALPLEFPLRDKADFSMGTPISNFKRNLARSTLSHFYLRLEF